MLSELLIAVGPGEWRALLREDGMPVEVFVERGEGGEVGSIHLGRIHRLLPGLGAILVDIGGDRPAFLPQNEVFPRGRLLDEGERVIVQIRREAQGGKPSRMTTGVVLRNRLIELRIGGQGFVDGKTLSAEDRARLLAAAAEQVEEASLRDSVGLKVLEPGPVEKFVVAIAGQIQRWSDILGRAARLAGPIRLDPPATCAAALGGALASAPDRVLADDPAVIPEIRAAFPAAVTQYTPAPEWATDLDAMFHQALSDTIPLEGGGWLHFDATSAGVLIDVDSETPEAGSPERTGVAVNLAAAKAVARQIRLRNLGGGIIVDFVGLEDRRLRERICTALGEALASDPSCPRLLGWTRLGHLELVRPRRRRPVAEALLEMRPGGPLVKTARTVAHEALGALRREARARPEVKWRLTVSPDVATALAGGAAPALRSLEERFGRKVAIASDNGLNRERFEIGPV